MAYYINKRSVSNQLSMLYTHVWIIGATNEKAIAYPIYSVIIFIILFYYLFLLLFILLFISFIVYFIIYFFHCLFYYLFLLLFSLLFISFIVYFIIYYFIIMNLNGILRWQVYGISSLSSSRKSSISMTNLRRIQNIFLMPIMRIKYLLVQYLHCLHFKPWENAQIVFSHIFEEGKAFFLSCECWWCIRKCVPLKM